MLDPLDVGWVDAESAILAVAGPTARDGLWYDLEILASCGPERRTWSVDGGPLPAGGTVEVSIPDVDTLADMLWVDYGVELVVRVQLVDEAGQVVTIVSAPDRMVWFEDGEWRLGTMAEAVASFAPAVADGDVVEAALPPAAVVAAEVAP